MCSQEISAERMPGADQEGKSETKKDLLVKQRSATFRTSKYRTVCVSLATKQNKKLALKRAGGSCTIEHCESKIMFGKLKNLAS